MYILPGIVRQVALFSSKKASKIKSICRFDQSSISLFACVDSTENIWDRFPHISSRTEKISKRFLHSKYQIVFHEVQQLPIIAVPITEMSNSPEKEGRSSSMSAPKGMNPNRFRRPSGIIAPPARKGMVDLKRDAFEKDIKIPMVYVYEDRLNPQTLQTFKKFMLKIQGLKPVLEAETPTKSTSTELKTCDDISSPASVRKLKKILINPELLKGNDLTHFVQHEIQPDPSIVSSVGYETVKFKYEHWTLNQIIDSVLPDEEEKVSGFSQVGHIIHLNLRDHVLPYKKLIGEVFLDKIHNAKTVVNKINIIESKYRNFQMELLAGDPNTVVTVKENRCEFEFDFASVYWNPRLGSEHDRLVKSMETGEIMYDVFAGVGPFTIPAAKKKITVLANDLNPDSFKWLQHNVQKNKVSSFVNCFNMDGRAFIQETASEDLVRRLGLIYSKDGAQEDVCTLSTGLKRFHFVMNLPALAVEFLDAFWGILSKHRDGNELLRNLSIIVHVYCFIKDVEGFKEKAVKLVKERLGYDFPNKNLVEVLFIRNVAPNKEMLRVSFLLPVEVMIGSDNDKSKALKRKFSEIDEGGGVDRENMNCK